jgi:peptide/nickel transport system ATP-binding protein
MSLLEVSDLTIALPAGADRANAVDGVSLRVERGQTLCVVGESGSGKSLAAAAIVRLLPSPQLRITRGRILFEGRDTLALGTRELFAIRGGRIGYVFQDPLSCLNPLERVGRQVREVLDRHCWPGDRAGRVVQLLDDVGLPEPRMLADKYPWQMSGGQRQRVMIAIALAADPALIVADEPTTAIGSPTPTEIDTSSSARVVPARRRKPLGVRQDLESEAACRSGADGLRATRGMSGGTEPIRRCVYASRGRLRIALQAPVSTTRPSFRTVT